MTTIDYSYIGAGQVYLRNRDGSGGLVPVGNVAELNLSVEEEEKTLRDYTAGGGGLRNEVSRIQGVSAKMKLHDISPANLAIALYGSASAIDSGSITGEIISVKKGALVPLAHVAASSVVITEDTDTSPATYVAGTDYEVRTAGIWFPDASTIPGATVRVNYTHPGQDVVEAITQTAGIYELVFDGLNEARSGKPQVVTAHRVRFGAAADLSLIGDDYAGLELAGSLLADNEQGAGLSRFFKAVLVQ